MIYSPLRRFTQRTTVAKPVRAGLLIALFAVLSVGSQGCTLRPVQRSAPDSIQSTPFMAPTPLPQSTPTNIPSQATLPRPTPTTVCTDGLTYLSDLTVPDGSMIQPGASIDKRWEVKNSGTCNWEAGYSLRLIAGSDLGAVPDQALIPARSETNLVIRLVFLAPLEPGNYRSAWQAHNPAGQPFGDPIYMEITVAEP